MLTVITGSASPNLEKAAISSSQFWGIACLILSHVSTFPIRLSKNHMSMTIHEDLIINFVPVSTHHITSVCVHILTVHVELIDYAHTMGRPSLHVPNFEIIKGEQVRRFRGRRRERRRGACRDAPRSPYMRGQNDSPPLPPQTATLGAASFPEARARTHAYTNII